MKEAWCEGVVAGMAVPWWGAAVPYLNWIQRLLGRYLWPLDQIPWRLVFCLLMKYSGQGELFFSLHEAKFMTNSFVAVFPSHSTLMNLCFCLAFQNITFLATRCERLQIHAGKTVRCDSCLLGIFKKQYLWLIFCCCVFPSVNFYEVVVLARFPEQNLFWHMLRATSDPCRNNGPISSWLLKKKHKTISHLSTWDFWSSTSENNFLWKRHYAWHSRRTLNT